jgi:lia operon protein LiaG
VHSTSGKIDIAGASGAIDAGCTSGRIDITGASGAIDAECTSGEISIDVAGAVQPISASITSGSVSIYMPADAAFDIEAKTTSGGFSSDFNITVPGSRYNSFIGEDISGTVNGGGPLVSVSITSGNINLIGK